MRKAICLTVLALAACGENSGWNPNYSVGAQYGAATPYDNYKVEREKALTGKRDAPKTVPVARPFRAPTADEISGPTVRQVVGVQPRVAVVRTAPVPVVDATAALTRFAATTVHAPGTTLWRRPGSNAQAASRLCRSYASPDAAQAAFLAKGGPEADPASMDPDGDGFVCGWDPRPWRRAAPL